jgi:hypothetical protein
MREPAVVTQVRLVVMRSATGLSQVSTGAMRPAMRVMREARVASPEETPVTSIPAGAMGISGSTSRRPKRVLHAGTGGTRVSEGPARIPVLASQEPSGMIPQRPAAVSDDGWMLEGCPDRGPRLAQAT